MTVQSGDRGDNIPWEEMWQRIAGKKEGWPHERPRMTGKMVGTVVAIIAAIWLLTGAYTVGPGEVGVVRQFGKEIGQTGPGLHYHLPRPIQRVDKVNMQVIRKHMVGIQEISPDRYRSVPYESLMLTGDENIVDIHVFTYYKVKDASHFLFNVKNVRQTLKTALEVALRGVVGENAIDYVMIEGRGEVQDKTREVLQQLMDNYGSGLLITEVKLQEVDAPEEVRDAFHDVVRAKEDKNKLIRQAEGYAADMLPKARGEKEKQIKGAEAYKEQRIIRAQGDAEKFLKVWKEYKKAPSVTRKRLYLETIERILPDIEKIVIDSESGGSLLQFLPLKDSGVEKPLIEALKKLEEAEK